jgi:peptidoglycan/LPS O-acetylase OafA/YrhL
MRAFSVVFVMLFHFFRPHLLPGGYLGVDVFFVLSGFLIPSLLIREWERNRAVDLKAFYVRRALRLFPALAAILIVFTAVVLLDSSISYARDASLKALPFVVFYVGNIWEVHHSLGLFGHTWSLALEEQFYILFPAIFLILSRTMSRLNVARLLFLAAAAELLYRPVLIISGQPLGHFANNHDIAGLGGLLLGSALAFWLASPDRYRPRDSIVHVVAGIGVVAIILVVFVADQTPTDTAIWYSVVPLASAAILLDQVTSPQRWMARVLTFAPAIWIGRRSYGLYLWHYPIYYTILWTKPAPSHTALLQIGAFVLSFGVAAVSYAVIEKPALRLKNRFER